MICMTPSEKKLLIAVLIICGIIAISAQLEAAACVPGEIIVKFKGQSRGGQNARASESAPRPYVVAVDDAEAALTELKNRPDVEYAEPNYIITSESIPDDWGYPSSEWSAVDLPGAWMLLEQNSQSARTVRIAVLDSGVDSAHPELSSVLVGGYNIITHDTNTEDIAGHGTKVCGIIGAKGNNASGMAGVAWDAPIEIMPVKITEITGLISSGTLADAVEGIYFAVDHGARIINASWGSGDYSNAMKDAIQYARGHDVLFVCSAGNDAQNNDTVGHYPAGYNLDNIIAVAAMTRFGYLAHFSNYGSFGVHIVAPGIGLRATTLNGGIDNWVDGTSFSAAFVTGVAAMVAAENPALSVQDLRTRILQGSVISSQYSDQVNNSGGCVNAYNALMDIKTHALTDTSAWTPPQSTNSEDGEVKSEENTMPACFIETAEGGQARTSYLVLPIVMIMFLFARKKALCGRRARSVQFLVCRLA